MRIWCLTMLKQFVKSFVPFFVVKIVAGVEGESLGNGRSLKWSSFGFG